MSDSLSPTIDIDLRIYKTGDSYKITAQTAESGLAEHTPDTGILFTKAFQAKLEQIRTEPFTINGDLLREVGETLFEFLFQGQVKELFLSLWVQHVQSDENGSLRLRLNIDEAAIELAEIPWEMMYWQDVFLATQISSLVTRQLLNLDYGNIKSLKVAGAPRVLIVIPGGSGLETEAEEKAIIVSLKKAKIPYDVLKEQVSLQDLDDALAAGDYAILHFIGHARFGENEKGEVHGQLRFNQAQSADDPGAEDWAPETDIQSLLGNYKTLKLVVLNACHTGEIGEHPQRDGFWGIIPALLRAGIPAVVAMQYAVRDDVAALFGETFYKRLTTGKWAGHVDVAVTLARNACYLAYPDDRGFATPALYLRSRDGIIFDKDDITSPADDKHQTPDCVHAPRPSKHLLYKYRHLDIEELNARLPVLKGRLQRLGRQIEALHDKTSLDERQQWRLARHEKNYQEMERELDELRDLLSWKLFTSCDELRKLIKKVQAKQQEESALTKAGAYVSYELKNEIFKLNERILKLKQLLKEGEETLQGLD